MNKIESLVPIEHSNQRVLLTSQLAEMYGTTEKTISYNFNYNKDHYREGIDYMCLTGEALRTFKRESGISGIADNLNKLYLWTEHGALLHAKSLGTDEAWAVYRVLLDTYFNVCKQVSGKSSPKKMKTPGAFTLPAVTAAVKTAVPILREAGMEPPDLALAMQQMYRQAGFDLAVDTLPADRKFFTREMIADQVGLLSKASGEPYGTGVSAIIQKLDIGEDEKRLVRFENNGHPGEDIQFAESVAEKVGAWLKENDYPPMISFTDKNGKVTNRHVKYRRDVAI